MTYLKIIIDLCQSLIYILHHANIQINSIILFLKQISYHCRSTIMKNTLIVGFWTLTFCFNFVHYCSYIITRDGLLEGEAMSEVKESLRTVVTLDTALKRTILGHGRSMNGDWPLWKKNEWLFWKNSGENDCFAIEYRLGKTNDTIKVGRWHRNTTFLRGPLFYWNVC